PPRLVMLSGDWIPLDLVPRSRERFPASRLVSLGGATEAAIWSIVHPIDSELAADWHSVPYGRPLANQRFHILDHAFHDRPDWVPGELFIAGDGLARGYWGDPQRTQDRFVTHPATGERLYRTGDLGRYRPGGLIEFLGRDDHQVKIAGHRIELGEIEAALASHPAVARAVAHAIGTPPAPRRLAAYVVPADPAAPPTPDELRAHLAERLPSYMVPRHILAIDAIPLSPNGKLDKAKLPTIQTQQVSLGVSELPLSKDEALLAKLWGELLSLDQVKRSDHFFEIGGNSLLAVRMVNGLRERHHLALPLRQIFADPVLANLTSHLRPVDGEMSVDLTTLVDGEAGQPLFFVLDSLSEGRAVVDIADCWLPGRPLVAVSGRIDAEGPEALPAYITKAVAAIRQRQPNGPYGLAGYSTGGLLAWEIAASLERAGDSVSTVTMIDSRPLPSALARDREAISRILSRAVSGGDDTLAGHLSSTIAAVSHARLAKLKAPVRLLQAEKQPGDLWDTAIAWRNRQTALAVETIGGDHFTCVRAPYASALAGLLQAPSGARMTEMAK
ncbi:MAG: AMP-binding protein, partial [Rhodospirillales bacterium]|nr:AMP-binding protein [Rhodospirillales bacterium]